MENEAVANGPGTARRLPRVRRRTLIAAVAGCAVL
ncbi:hypothetical protein SZN_37241, partial [Streptomyces zinciresistens K42]